MKTQNRPELKVGDRVRFRSDGEIGELNRSQNLNTEIFHTVKKICKDGRVYHEGGGAYAQVQFDICNDFSDIQVGDKVERYWKHWKHKLTTDTVASVSENEFKLENCEKIGCGLSISKADGIHGDFPDGGDYWYVLRIVDKAKPKPDSKFDIHINSREWKGVSKTYTGIAMEKTRLIEDILSAKPKPLLADAKVGDLCQLRSGKYTQIAKIEDGIFKYQAPDENFCIGLYWCDITGNTDKWGKVEDFDIIHTEPLAPEGSAEWAWQMLNLLGLPIYHPAEGVLTIPVPYSSERFAHCYAKTGWQIHEPEPAFKVGDWVEFRDIEGIKHGMVEGIQEEYSILCAGVSQSVGKKFIIRKLSPSEVIVKIGCLSGTVELLTWKRAGFNLITKHGRCWILLDALDAPTRELVESLLKAQEEEK